MNHFCRQASRLASDQLDGPLRVWDRLHLWLHLAMCGACRNNARAMQKLHRIVVTSASEISPHLDASERQRIAEALRSKHSAE